MGCWCGYLSGSRCRLFACGPADATASQTPLSFASFKSRLVLPFWYQLTQVVMEKRPLNVCSSSGSSSCRVLFCWNTFTDCGFFFQLFSHWFEFLFCCCFFHMASGTSMAYGVLVQYVTCFMFRFFCFL